MRLLFYDGILFCSVKCFCLVFHWVGVGWAQSAHFPAAPVTTDLPITDNHSLCSNFNECLLRVSAQCETKGDGTPAEKEFLQGFKFFCHVELRPAAGS